MARKTMAKADLERPAATGGAPAAAAAVETQLVLDSGTDKPAEALARVGEWSKQLLQLWYGRKQIAQRGAQMLAWATALVITTPEERVAAEERYAQVQQNRRWIEKAFEEVKAPINGVRAWLLGMEKEALAPVTQSERMSETKIQDARRREQRERERVEEEARQALLQQKQRDNDAEAARLREEVASAPTKQVAKAIEREAKAIEEQPVVATHSEVQQLAEKTAPLVASTVKIVEQRKWRTENFDLQLLVNAVARGEMPLRYLQCADVELNKALKGLEDQVNQDPKYAAAGIRNTYSDRSVSR